MSVLTDQELKHVLGKDVVICPRGDEDCFSSKGYDLRIGFVLPLSDETHATDLSATGTVFFIPPKRSAFIITKEFVWLSKKLVGSFHLRAGVAAHGLHISSTTIDSGWHFQLLFLAYNASDLQVELRMGQPFITLMLHRVAVPSTKPPPENFIQVVVERAKGYGEVYSNKLKDQLLYLDPEEQRCKNEFEEQKRKAQSPSLRTQLWSNMRDFFKGTPGKFRQVATILLWVIVVVLLTVSLTLQFYWSWLGSLFHFNEPYGGLVLVTQLLAFFAGLGFLLDLLKKK